MGATRLLKVAARRAESLLANSLGRLRPKNLRFSPAKSIAIENSAHYEYIRLEEAVQRNSEAVEIQGVGAEHLISWYRGPGFTLPLETVKLTDATVWTNAGYVETEQKDLVRSFYAGAPTELTPDPHLSTSHWLTHKFTRKPLHLTGVTFSLLSPGSEGYYHFLIESLPRLFIANRCVDLQSIQHILVPVPFRLHVEHCLRQMDLEFLIPRLISVGKRDAYRCEQLLLTSNPSYGGWLTSTSLEGFQRLRDPTDGSHSPSKIYVSRANRRRVSNEGELIELVSQFGFEPVELSNLSMGRQVSLFSRADFVIGPHGAGLANLVFSSNCTVLELMASHYTNLSFAEISETMNLRHLVLVEPGVVDLLTHDSTYAFEDFAVDINRVREALAYLGAS